METDRSEEEERQPSSGVSGMELAKKVQEAREHQGLIFEQVEGERGLRRPQLGKTRYVTINRKKVKTRKTSAPRTMHD